MNSSIRKKNRLVFSLAILSWLLMHVLASCSKSDNPTPPQPSNLELLSFTPSHALRGATIILTGKNFSTTKSENQVTFPGDPVNATVLAASNTELSVVVPAAAVTGKIKVKVGTQTVESGTAFVVDEDEVASIIDFTPKEGPSGTIVTLTGTKFGNDIQVSLNNIVAQVTQKNATQIVFVIPTNSTLTSHKIKVVSDGTTLETAENFTVSNPVAQWIRKDVNHAPSGIFQFGLSFVHKNKIYWGFSKVSFNQSHTDYMVFDPSAVNPQWVMGNPPPADMAPASLQNAVAVVHNDKVYMGTGLAPTATKTWWQYDPETNTSTRLADYPENTANALAFVFNNKIYAGFGGASKKLHEYDPLNNSWKLITTTELEDLSNASAFVIGNEAFIGRGLATPGNDRKEFLRFTGTSLLPSTAFPEIIQSPETPSFVLGNKGYFVTGRKVWEFSVGQNGGTWKPVINDPNGPVIKYTALVSVSGAPVIYGWNGMGEMFEFKLN